MIVPDGFAASVAVGSGSPSDSRSDGTPPDAPVLVTGPYVPTNGGFFISDCDM